ncbi:unnamed protein product [Brachionus calyciflorus]|uniref:Protein regulator of cytokinesis 1 n=1 Tax=Brachionus calyciflorus TaxID=104777 RepID=A0A814H6X4_9BILA|nr:unnamed protein product [Brachionus calyciflorus]
MSDSEQSYVDSNMSEVTESMLEDEEMMSPVHQSKLSFKTRYKNTESPLEKSSNSKRKSDKKKSNNVSSKNTSKNCTNQLVEKDLRQNMKDYFAYNLCACDFTYLKTFYDTLNKLEDVWNRIGFNVDTKQKRLDTFYKHMSDNSLEILENEIILEEKIMENIEGYHRKIKDICFKLHIKYDDLKLIKNVDTLSLLEQEDAFKQEYKKLEKEVKKRVEEYKILLNSESKLCDKLVIKKTEYTEGSIPSEHDINSLKKRIDEYEKLVQTRRREMSELQIEIADLNQELETSRTDSFIENIIFESVDNITLSDKDMKKAYELRDELKRKREILKETIRSLRSKIVELWTKLNITNPECQILLNENDHTKNMSKRELVNELEREHERCIEIKMENMQKFIEAIRLEIREMCQKMFIGDKEIKKMNQEFLGLTEFTEQLLTIHEEKLEDLKFRYEECQNLYEKTTEWTQLWNKFVQFEEKTKDPLRFKQRGYNMLEEEKQRKKFNNELPKLEEDLKKLALEYAEINGGQEFSVFGQSFTDYILTTKLDYEESKQKEKIEKQVLKDTQKKNESRFGSKPKTPLALKNKRKLLGNNNGDSRMNSPARHSKLQKTDMTASTFNTPGTTIMGSSRLGSGAVKSKINSNLNSKSKLANKRKSRTPGNKRLLRRSKMMAKQNEENENNTTLKTTFSSTIQSTVSSNNSKMTKSGNNSSKCPPVSSSSRYASQQTIHRMTSTASNTFIEDEGENFDRDGVVVQAAAKISEMVAIKGSNETKMYNYDVNYLEFSRDLPKPFKFGHDSTNSLSSISSKSSSRHAQSKSTTRK